MFLLMHSKTGEPQRSHRKDPWPTFDSVNVARMCHLIYDQRVVSVVILLSNINIFIQKLDMSLLHLCYLVFLQFNIQFGARNI